MRLPILMVEGMVADPGHGLPHTTAVTRRRMIDGRSEGVRRPRAKRGASHQGTGSIGRSMTERDAAGDDLGVQVQVQVQAVPAVGAETVIETAAGTRKGREIGVTATTKIEIESTGAVGEVKVATEAEAEAEAEVPVIRIDHGMNAVALKRQKP